VGREQHIALDSICINLNHSCAANTLIDTQTMTLRAIADIPQDHELTFNYLTTELQMHTPFDCFCHSPVCFGSIKGFAFLSVEQKRDLVAQGNVAPHLVEHLTKSA